MNVLKNLKQRTNSSLLKIQIKGLLDCIIYNTILLSFSFLFDRFYQMLLFILFYNTIQNSFKYRFHADTIQENPIKAVKLCKFITIFVELIYLILCKNIDISVYSNLFIIFIICLSNAILEFALENFFIKEDDLRNESKLLLLCKKAKLSKNATDRMMMKYIENKTYQEIADLECVDVQTIKISINRSRHKIFKD